jgi:peptidyl-prolyl cis-trans isomerase SurA
VAQTAATADAKNKKKRNKHTEEAAQKPGKKEKIRFGRAPEETLPSAAGPTETEDAGAVTQAGGDTQTANAEQEPINPLEYSAPPEKKTRFSDRARVEKHHKKKAKAEKKDVLAPEPPTAAEVADRQTQSTPLGLAGDTSKKKKKNATTVGEKTRFSEVKRKENEEKKQEPPPVPTPIAPVAGAPAPATAPQ